MTQNMPSTLATDISELAQQFDQVAIFMQRRADIRTNLMQNKSLTENLSSINSLSILENQTKEKNQKNNKKPPTELQLLIQNLTEQINEGHTILTLNTAIAEHAQLYQALHDSQWVTVLSNQIAHNDTSHLQKVDKPIIMQVLAQESHLDVWGNPEQIREVVVWLHRQWFAEHQLALQLLAIAERPVTPLNLKSLESFATDKNDKKTPNERQQRAIDNACNHSLSIITGGPGTGKTFTVAQLVIALQQAHEEQKKLNPYLPPLSIALTAPTGKAAQRMQESLTQNLPLGKIELDTAKTLHRLLGIGSNGIPRYHHDNPLPDDLVIVDEASMLGLELASQLVDAIKPTGRLVLLGDANQLAAVDAGAVLADLCAVSALRPYRTELAESRRFDDKSAIGQLALIIKQPATTATQQKQKVATVKKLLKPKNVTNNAVNFYKINHDSYQNYIGIYQQLSEPFQDFFAITKQLLESPLRLEDGEGSDSLAQLFHSFDKYRILSAGHHGKLGDVAINQTISQFHKRKILHLPLSDSYFYHGQPVMMLKNDYQLGLFNGDIGICLLIQQPNSQLMQLMVCFPTKVIEVSRMGSDSCTTAYALTIHKSQGSEFQRVAVCLDTMHARLLSQELIYTAITRSKQLLDIYSNEMVLNTAIVQKGNRQTGLTLQF